LSSHRSGVLRTSIIGLGVVYLAWAAQSAVSYLFTSRNPAASTISIEAIERHSETEAGARHNLVLEALLVDGRALRLETLDRTPAWEDVPNSGNADFLSFKGSDVPAFLNFRGGRFVALMSTDGWSGVVRVKRNGETVQELDAHPFPTTRRLVIEDPVAPRSVGAFLVALGLFTAAAFWLGRIRDHRFNGTWIVFFLGVLHLLYWISHPIGVNGDSVSYLPSFIVNLNGSPSYYPPGYPALVALVHLFAGGHTGFYLTLLQHALIVIGAFWLYQILQMVVVEELALLGGILAGCMGPALTIPQDAISETAAYFAMTGAMYYALRAAQTRRMSYVLAAGALGGWAVTLRVVPIAATVPAIVGVCVFNAAKDKVKTAAILLVAAALVILVPVSWFWLKSSQLSLASSAGSHLFNRVVLDQKLLDQDGLATRKLISLLGGRDPRTFALDYEVRNQPALVRLGFLRSEHLLQEVSKEAIYQNPAGVFSHTFYSAWQLFLVPTDWIPPWSDTDTVAPDLENSPLLSFSASGLSWRWMLGDVNDYLWPVLCIGAILGVIIGLFHRSRVLIVMLGWNVALYIISSAAGEIYTPRYNGPTVPMVAALALIPLDLVYRWFLRQKDVYDGGFAYSTEGPRAALKALRGLRIPTGSNLPADPMVDNGLRDLPLYLSIISALQSVLFVCGGYSGIFAIAGIGLGSVQIGSALRRRKSSAARGVLLAIILFAMQFLLFLVAPSPGGMSEALRLLHVSAIAMTLSAVVWVVVLWAGLLRPAGALILAIALATAGIFGEAVLGRKHSPEPVTIWPPDSMLIANMRTGHAPQGLHISAAPVTVSYTGDPNGEFQEADSRPAQWMLSVAGGNRARFVFPPSDVDSERIEILKHVTTVNYHVFAYLPNLQSKADTKYLLKFRARADKPRKLIVGFARTRDWENFGFGTTIPLTAEWKEFSFSFTTTPTAADVDAAVHFNVGEEDPAVEIGGVRLINGAENNIVEPAVPTAHGGYRIRYTFTAEGCRSAISPSPKAPGVKRILMLGNSFTLGAGVLEEATVSSRLERSINGSDKNEPRQYQVINCAQSGYGTHDERLFYELLGADYHPDLVLLGLTWRDDMSVWEEMSRPRPGKLESMFFSVRLLRGHLNPGPHADFTKCVEQLKALDQAVKQKGSRLAIFIFRNNADYAGLTESGKTWNKLTTTVAEGLRGTSIPILDTGKILKQGNAEDLKANAPIPQDPNEVAHAIAARELVPFLREHLLLP
jgi:hypothetical protein